MAIKGGIEILPLNGLGPYITRDKRKKILLKCASDRFYKTEKGRLNRQRKNINFKKNHPNYMKDRYWNIKGEREMLIQKSKVYRERYPDKVSLYTREYRQKQRLKMFDILGDYCKWCGMTLPVALTIDHIKDNGKSDRDRFGGHAKSMWAYYIKHPDEAKEKLQVLCWNCNMIKATYLRMHKPNIPITKEMVIERYGWYT